MDNVVRVENIYKVYEKQNKKFEALKGININVKKGEFLGIMGPSGSGKSTLVNILSTLDCQTNGKVFINGQDVSGMDNEAISDFRRENIGFIFQNYNLIDTLTNKDNIIAPLLMAGADRKEIYKRVDELAEKLGIEKILNKYPLECSGGQKQRVSIARALSNKPKVIFADEPTDSLDVKRAIEVIELLKKINIEEGVTTVLVTHDQFIGSYSDRIVLIKDGQVDKEIVRKYKLGEEQGEFYNKILKETSKEVEELFKDF
ncbi:MAG: ABC transporter ATP-binding protein [Clostridium sp.]|uniref:ABC transporter ATP-binding protein n=1 Tax=Clostridium sp. TaxID=1506 RepID=UPI003F3D912C